MSLPYYKKYPRDLFEGTVGMPMELKGVYNLLIDLIMLHDDKLPDDSGYISGQLGCTKNKWAVVKKKLVALGKISISDGKLTNNRAKTEQKLREKYVKSKEFSGQQPRQTRDKSLTDVSIEKKRQNQNHIPSSSLAREGDELAIREVCIKAAKPVLNAERIAWMPIKPILNLLNDENHPCDLEADILPAIRQVAARGSPSNMKNLNYFVPIAIQYRDERLAGTPKPEISPNGGNNGKRDYHANTRAKPKTLAEVALDNLKKSSGIGEQSGGFGQGAGDVPQGNVTIIPPSHKRIVG